MPCAASTTGRFIVSAVYTIAPPAAEPQSPSREELRRWATAALRQFDLHLHEHGAELAQLRDAGVSELRIDALYPFEAADYRDGMSQLLANVEAAVEQAQAWQEFGVHTKVGKRLPQFAREGYLADLERYETNELLAENLQVRGQRAFTSANYLNHLLENLHEYAALLRALRRWPHADLLSSVEPEDFDTLQRCADVLALRLAHRGAEAELLPA